MPAISDPSEPFRFLPGEKLWLAVGQGDVMDCEEAAAAYDAAAVKAWGRGNCYLNFPVSVHA